jgi:TetR/AcrR family transcriptional regulator, repressor for lfrA
VQRFRWEALSSSPRQWNSTAVGRLTEQAVADASKRARLADGTGLDAVLRLCQEYFELSDVLTVLFFTSGVYDETTSCLSDDDAIAAIERGREDSSIDAALDASWILNMMWALLYAAVDHVNRGSAGRMHSQTQALTSLRKAIGGVSGDLRVRGAAGGGVQRTDPR